MGRFAKQWKKKMFLFPEFFKDIQRQQLVLEEIKPPAKSDRYIHDGKEIKIRKKTSEANYR